MKYTTITTPDNIEINFRLAGAGSRIAAAVIDLVVQSVLFLTIALIFILAFVGNNIIAVSSNLSGWAVAILLLALFLIFFGYYIVCELLTNGRSIGKIIFKLRVVRENGQPIGFTQSLVRNIFRNTVDLPGIGIVSMLFSKSFKRIGDMAASTIVISENSSRIITESLSLDNLLNDRVSMAVTGDYILTDDEFYFVKEYINRKDTFLSVGEDLKKIISSYFAKKYDVANDLVDDAFIENLYASNIYKSSRSNRI